MTSFVQLQVSDVPRLKELLAVFGDAFDDKDTYLGAVPSDAYLTALLSKPHFIALVALEGSEVVGGLAAYELEKFERDRREIYIYDLAVAEAHRRKRIATDLILALKEIAKRRRAYVIYVQADLVDPPAIKLYESLGTREEVLHFDILIDSPGIS